MERRGGIDDTCSSHQEIELATTRYVWDEKAFAFRNRDTGELSPYDPKAAPTIPLAVWGDIPAHVAPGGHYVRSRSDLKTLEDRTGLVPYARCGELMDAPSGVFDAKCDRWKSWMRSKQDKVAERAGFNPKHAAVERELRDELAKDKRKRLAKAKR